jgi:hypothetical protein
VGYVGHGSADGGAEDQEGDGGQEEAGVDVEEGFEAAVGGVEVGLV